MRVETAIAVFCMGLGLGRVAQAEPERLVHRYLEVEISPNGELVASVEGDSSKSGGAPTVRDLVIRHVSGGAAVTVPMPCGRVPQCWPDSPTWSSDGKHVAFSLRTPGSHARSLYAVAADGSGLDKLLDFSGTIVRLRYLPDGRLAMLAIQNATKEVGATQAGTAIAGDLDAPPPEQRIAVLQNGALQWISPPDLFVYEYDWRAGGKGFIATAAPGDGDNNWWTAKLYAFPESGGVARVIYTPADARQQLAMPKVSRDGPAVAFIAGIMSDFGSTGGDVYTLAIDGGVATNLTPGMHDSATAISWRCDGQLQAEMLAGDKTQFADLGSGLAPKPPKSRVERRGVIRRSRRRNIDRVSLGIDGRLARNFHDCAGDRSRHNRPLAQSDDCQCGIEFGRPRAKRLVEERRIRYSGVAAAAPARRG